VVLTINSPETVTTEHLVRLRQVSLTSWSLFDFQQSRSCYRGNHFFLIYRTGSSLLQDEKVKWSDTQGYQVIFKFFIFLILIFNN
jgi:hypothetical protein